MVQAEYNAELARTLLRCSPLTLEERLGWGWDNLGCTLCSFEQDFTHQAEQGGTASCAWEVRLGVCLYRGCAGASPWPVSGVALALHPGLWSAALSGLVRYLLFSHRGFAVATPRPVFCQPFGLAVEQ